jgi:hypothetical protein
MMIGGVLGGLVMWVAVGTILMAFIGAIAASGVLGSLDFMFSKGIIKALNSRPNGGRW